jgi:N-acetylmuramoyl-L-alanine amidase
MDCSRTRRNPTKWRQVLALATFLVAGVSAAATSHRGPARVDGIAVSATGAATRVVLELSGPVTSTVFTLDHPDRVVIDLNGAFVDAPRLHLPPVEPPVRLIRVAARGRGIVRVVLDLDRRLRPQLVNSEPGTERARVIVDLLAPGAVPPTITAPAEVPTVAYAAPRDLVIAVDAGHGGEDPGATGRDGTREKDVTLAVARALATRINAEPGMRAVLTRTGDYFVPLRERIHRARVAQADLFVSVHADAVADRSVAGSSVYVLSQRGASSEAAKWLADRENAADLVGGVSLDDKDGVLASVLLDLSQSAAMSASMIAAEKVLDELNEIGELRKARVQQAGFVVLKSPDIPSLLIERAYITNPGEERRLRDPQHQARLADAILTGLRNYFRANPPPGSRFAALVAAGN